MMVAWHPLPYQAIGRLDIRTGCASPEAISAVMEFPGSSPVAKHLPASRTLIIGYRIPTGFSCGVYGGRHIRTASPLTGRLRVFLGDLRLVGRGVAGHEYDPATLLA